MLEQADTVRFSALLLRDTGMSRANPREVISRNTDWSFLEKLKKEL